jgi:hypothetical protein
MTKPTTDTAEKPQRKVRQGLTKQEIERLERFGSLDWKSPTATRKTNDRSNDNA